MSNNRKTDPACEQYESKLADAVERAAERGQELSSAELSRALLRWGLEPTLGAPLGFMTRVFAAIRVEEERLTTQRISFWRPLEHLAGRVALAACAAVMVVSFYVYAYVAPHGQSQDVTELVQQPDIQQPQTPDDVLMSLAERTNVR